MSDDVECLDCDALIDWHRADPPIRHFQDGCYITGHEDHPEPREERPMNDTTATKTLEVQRESGAPFRVTVPKDARVTFGPWSPPPKDGGYDRAGRSLTGTLRIYEPGPKTADACLAVFSGVTGFRDLSIDYAEQVAVEVGSIVWNSDKSGYSREEKVHRDETWEPKAVGPGKVVTEDESPF